MYSVFLPNRTTYEYTLELASDSCQLLSVCCGEAGGKYGAVFSSTVLYFQERLWSSAMVIPGSKPLKGSFGKWAFLSVMPHLSFPLSYPNTSRVASIPLSEQPQHPAGSKSWPLATRSGTGTWEGIIQSMQAGEVSQWETTCLTHVKPWIWSPATHTGITHLVFKNEWHTQKKSNMHRSFQSQCHMHVSRLYHMSLIDISEPPRPL